MQKYKPKTLPARIADHLFRLALSCLAGTAWFVYLWGVRLTALTSGVALGGLIWLCIRQFGLMSTRKREKQMRRLIGGELELSRLLLLPPKQAGFQAAVWLGGRFPFVMQRTVDWGVMGTLADKPTLVHVIAQHETLAVNVQQIVEALRKTKSQKAQRCLLCITSPLSKEAAAYARQHPAMIRIISRNELIDLAGLCSPATDEQLSQLRKSKKVRRSKSEWLQIILQPNQARRYFWFGMTLGTLAVLTQQKAYPVPAAVCLLLAGLTKLRASGVLFRTRIGEGDPFQNG